MRKQPRVNTCFGSSALIIMQRAAFSLAALTDVESRLDQLHELQGATSTASRGSPARRQVARTASCRPGIHLPHPDPNHRSCIRGCIQNAARGALSTSPCISPMLLTETLVVLVLWLAFAWFYAPGAFRVQKAKKQAPARSRPTCVRNSCNTQTDKLRRSKCIERISVRQDVAFLVRWKRSDGHPGRFQI